MGPAAVSNMANGTFIRSESRPMEVLSVKSIVTWDLIPFMHFLLL